MTLDGILGLVGDEVTRAEEKFARFNSPHEGWAVIQEEVDELWAEVKANRGRTFDAWNEARQIAAMAVRYMRDCGHEDYGDIHVSAQEAVAAQLGAHNTGTKPE